MEVSKQSFLDVHEKINALYNKIGLKTTETFMVKYAKT